MDTSLAGRVAFATGGGSGIGAAACRAFADAGAAVGVADRDRERAEAVAREIEAAGGRALALAADVTDEGAVARAVGDTAAAFGGLHAVFANAGIGGMMTPIEEMTLDEWNTTLGVNLTGAFLTVKHSIPHLRDAGGGSIAVTASVNGTRQFSSAGHSAYATSKGGLAVFARMAATELARWGIRVNTISPGPVRTDIDASIGRRNLDAIRYGVRMPERFPPLTGDRADPAEVANIAVFLAADTGRYITGAEILIDGGLTLLSA